MRNPFSAPDRWRVPRWLAREDLKSLTLKVGVVVVLFVGACEWHRDENRAARPREVDPSPAGSGIIVRYEVLAVWVPQALLDLGQREDAPIAARTPGECRAILERHGLGDVWCALVYRTHQANGAFTDITLILRPNEPADLADKFQDVLAVVANRPPRGHALEFNHAAVRVIPEELLEGNPHEVVATLLELTDSGQPNRGRPDPVP